MVKEKIAKFQQFIQRDIWRIRRDTTDKRQFILIRIVRIFILAVRRFLSDDCVLKASALTYYSLISVVPVAALAFAIAKGFGFRETLEREIENRLVGHEEVANWIQDFALSYLDNVQGGMIAGIGIVILIWSVMKILGNIEKSFNDVWDITRARSMVRKFSDYISFVLIATFLMMLSSSFIAVITNSIQVFDLGRIATPIIIWSSPYILMWVVFALMFMIMPNTKVKFSSAFFGGVFTGTFFLLLQFAYIYFQVGMSKYNAIYGSFAALPLFLIWMHSSWMVVLFGAELSYAFQNEKSFEYEYDTDNVNLRYRKKVSLLIVKKIVDCFSEEKPAPTSAELSALLKLPVRMVSDLLRKLEDAGILVEILALDNDRDIGYGPAFDINKMTVFCILEKIENFGTSDFHFADTAEYKRISAVLESFDKLNAQSQDNILLKDV
ncbi:YihY/virulence factor BrkB family protein [Marinilabiliaceae bacterium ANBcel2]|nr:YihY/virulence factor BrkB family protein [Marinilabiliaceae bacterium ANBcel2]